VAVAQSSAARYRLLPMAKTVLCSLAWPLLLVTVGISGCAFGDRHVALNYPPPAPADAPPPKLTPAPAKGITVVVARFTDERTEKPVGEVRNGFGMHTADVLAESDVTAWVMKAVGRELAAAGYTVRWAGKGTDAERVQLSGQTLTTYCRAMATYEGEVSFMAQLTVDGKLVFNKRITGKGGAGVNMAATEEGFGDSLSIALRDAMAHLLAELQPVARALGPAPPAAPNEKEPPATALAPNPGS
jgi:hypothetical protein